MKGMEKLSSQFYVDKTKLLGKGNFGQVYKGYMLSENKIIAVKFMSRTKFKDNPDYERQIFVMEDLAKLKHPNIMSYYGFQEKPEGMYLFIEFCAGGSLTQQAKKKMSEIKVITLLRQLFDAMSYINKQNKVHRDLKPDNILLDQNLQLKIADFGLARNVQVQMTKGACTPLFAAPQVYNQQFYDQKCDVWSSGQILFQMLTGKQMFNHIKTRNQLKQAFNKFKKGEMKIQYPKQFHKKWTILTQKMLTYDPSKRPSFAQLLQYFDEIKDDMQKDLNKKYDQDTANIIDINRSKFRAKNINPYLKDQQNKQKNDDPSRKLNQQRSFNIFTNVQKFLIFFRMKTDFVHKIIKSFTTNQYAILKNVYKYILMYCSVSFYISKIQQNLIQLQKGQINTPDGIISKKDLQQAHLKQWQDMINDYKSKHNSNIQKFKSVLNKQIISKITSNYLKREQEKKIITSYPNLLSFIENSEKGKFQKAIIYMQLFIKVMNQNDPYCSQNQLKAMQQTDVKTYAYIRLAGNLDQFFPNKQYKNQDYIRIRRQELENMEKQETIQFIQKYNKR